MNPNDDRVEEVFHAALEFAGAAEREAFLDAECKGDPAFAMRVRRLIEMHEGGGNRLESVPLSPEIEAELARLKPEEAGERIGPYKLLQQIGEGGFGVVWMAEQEQPVRRRVALKIIKIGMDTKEVIARFEQERQALAMMEHPNIAKVFDAGATQYGRPFFVMELVRGVKITDYCDDQQLSTDERIGLFVHVCQAVQHAHQKGIIHRDLKPSNILVTINDGEAVPKVIDFGVAKATQGRLTDGTLFTQFEQMVGTPLYMSPEQAELTSLDIDTRSDIYSLGVLLYELLTGRTPIDTATMARAGMDEIRRIIREVDPPRPSARVRTLDGNELTTTAKRRHTDSGKLPGMLRGDLDWIVMKCLEKDRKRRYDTANGLALDLQRHLANEIVTARPPTAAYLLGKLVRRHRGPVLAAAAVLLALIAGLVASTVLYFKAQTESAKNAQTAKFMTEMLDGIDPEHAKGRDVTVLTEILEQAAQRVDTELQDQPEVEATLRAAIGNTFGQLGQYAKALPHLERSRALRERVLGPSHRDTLNSMHLVASAYDGQGRYAEAEALLAKAIELADRTLSPKDSLTFLLHCEWADVCGEQGKFTEALARMRQTLSTCERVLPADDATTLKVRSYLANACAEAGLTSESETLRRKNLAMTRRVFGPEHPQTLTEMANLASALQVLDKDAEAEALHREGLEIYRRIYGPEHPSILVPMHNLAGFLSMRGKHAEAEALCRQELDLSRRVLGPEHPMTLSAMANLALSFDKQDRRVEAEALGREVLEISRRVRGPEHPDTLHIMHNLAAVLARNANIGEADEAEKLFAQALAMRNRVLGPEHRLSLASADALLLKLREGKRHLEAEALCRRTVESNERLLGREHAATLAWRNQLAISLKDQNQSEEAEKILRETFEIAKRTLPPDHPETLLSLWHLAHIHERAGRWDETLALWSERMARLPNDTILPLALAATQAWFGKTADHAETCRRFFKQVEGTNDAFAADRAAKAFCLLPSDDRAGLAQALAFARRAVELGAGQTQMPFYQLALGMAEYRNGNRAAADEALTAAEQTGSKVSTIHLPARFFRAMNLFHQDRVAEARDLFAATAAKTPSLPEDERQPYHGGTDHDGVIIWLAYKEAKATFDSAAKASAEKQRP